MVQKCFYLIFHSHRLFDPVITLILLLLCQCWFNGSSIQKILLSWILERTKVVVTISYRLFYTHVFMSQKFKLIRPFDASCHFMCVHTRHPVSSFQKSEQVFGYMGQLFMKTFQDVQSRCCLAAGNVRLHVVTIIRKLDPPNDQKGCE